MDTHLYPLQEQKFIKPKSKVIQVVFGSVMTRHIAK
ncbi:hypothetical protein T230_02705 [Tannerella sp. oral taxon BU063 isolate Cell 1/3]|uniref:Uncharacterized protein n=4 Tax=Tannerella serpentiformis TaxID=712710 RepID=W2CT92_9BACT|nr:hypothetical protein T229_01325 [Tannerella sp. oral taxon BU063 isolate Cell 5]ETK10258.1 hypothetical protein T230_02705 [Tannerella sp. oral taxon BU063 isolate Cell 1/3]